jgi:hypothetical protein
VAQTPCTVTATYAGDTNHTGSSATGTITISTVTLKVTAIAQSKQYSDPLPAFTVTYLGFVGSEGPGNLSGTLSCGTTASLTSPPTTYSITCGGLSSSNYLISWIPGILTVTKEDAYLEYTGDTIGLTGTSGLTLRATVWDSAASGSGITGDASMGDLTKMYIQFDVYTATSCGTGTPTTKVAQVSDTGTLGDGIGTATAQYSSSSEASYCVVAKLVGSLTANSVNTYYNADTAESAVITFYANTGQFVTGGGWLNDPAGSKGNFGFNARFNNSGSPQGQMVYVWRGLYNGELADYRIKSNSLTSLGFSCWNGTAYGTCPAGNATFPAKSALQGKSTILITRAKDGYILYSDGNSTFNATAADSGQSSGIGSDKYVLNVYDKNGVLYKQIGVPTELVLQGGNVVIHGTTK